MGEPIRILVVDDEENFRSTLKDFLSEYDNEVLTAENGVEALEILDKFSVNLIISDLRLPIMDGITFTRKVREMEKDIPVIVMTAYASIETAVEAMKSGAADYITKPFKFEHILFIIERVLETKKLRELAGKSEYYRKLSNIDDLTGIHNYRFFKEMLKHEIERHSRYNRPLSLLMIDIDNFKEVNDNYGHLVGDQVLRQTAHLLKKSIRSCDIVSRYGGEEFAVILPETLPDEALKVGDRIVKTIPCHDFKVAETNIGKEISVTVGLASFPKDADNAKLLIENSDKALYQGKQAGKNQVYVFTNLGLQLQV